MKSGNQENIKDDIAPAGSKGPWLIVGICFFLAVIVWAVFGQTRHFSFIDYDDNQYVYENAAFIHGLATGAASAFSWNAIDNWVPLTTLSHLLDWQLYGMNAGGHHVTNVLLHAATAILLFLVLYKMTAALWRSAFVAAVFAIHPLRAESVAWVSERKDVLCGVFFMLTLWAYWGYVRHPRSLLRYLLTLFLAALALLAKPVVVTLPFILLLLDYWPLKRWDLPATVSEPSSSPPRGRVPLARLMIEKIPFLLLSLASCIPTILSEQPGIAPTNVFPIYLRIENAVVSCVAYIWQFFYPARLAVLYPFPRQGLPFPEVAGALAFLMVVSLAAFYWRRKYPYLLAGWFWYLVMLVPVIGLVQVGEQARADRHTYLSQIGLDILLTWLVADLSVRLRGRRMALAGLSSVILAALIYGAHRETTYWKNSETLWMHTLANTSANPSAHLDLGYAYEDEGRLDDAIAQYEQTLEINPGYTRAHRMLGDVLRRQGRLDEAFSQYQAALEFDRGQDASSDCNDIGRIMLRKGQTANAILAFQKAVKFGPDNASAHDNLGGVLLSKGRLEDAAAQCQAAVKLKPENAGYQSNLAKIIWMLTKSPTANGEEILALAKSANQLSGGNNPLMLRALAAAYARCGQFPEAIATGNQALALAAKNQSPDFMNTLEQEIALYQRGSPLPLIKQTNAAGGGKR